jgi:hypothetical protein
VLAGYFKLLNVEAVFQPIGGFFLAWRRELLHNGGERKPPVEWMTLMAPDVFASYSSQDKPIADAVCAALESKKVRCWIAPRDILAGIPYGEALTKALDGGRVRVLVPSVKANESRHIIREVESAVDKGIPIVPFRIENFQPSKSLDYFLKAIHWPAASIPAGGSPCARRGLSRAI